MKIAIYTIALNERKHVEQYLETVRDADVIVVGDTGSTDDTVQQLEWHAPIKSDFSVVDVRVTPFRFDVARNAVLSQVPPDVDFCISLDMDETLEPGWREAIERCAAEAPGVTRIWANYQTDGLEGFYHNSRVHARHGYYWDHPCHECLVDWMIEEKQALSKSLFIRHHPDKTKPRSSYLGLLAAGVHERPWDRRRIFYYGRELCMAGMYQPALNWLNKYRELWERSGEDMWTEPEQAAGFIAVCEGMLKNPTQRP